MPTRPGHSEACDTGAGQAKLRRNSHERLVTKIYSEYVDRLQYAQDKVRRRVRNVSYLKFSDSAQKVIGVPILQQVSTVFSFLGRSGIESESIVSYSWLFLV